MILEVMQVMKENAKSGIAAVPASEKTPQGASKVSALVLSARRLVARTRSPDVSAKASKSLPESFGLPSHPSI